MRKILNLFILVIITMFLFSADSPKKQFYEMSNYEIDRLIQNVSKSDMSITQKINYFSEYFLGMPYDFKCVGDGPYALLEPWPLVNFNKTNCMSFCEHVLALSISDYWDNFFNNLQQIRYKDGFIGMKTRNHYTMADWFPQNNWILEGVSRKVGGNFTKQVTRTISHKKFFTNKGVTDETDVIIDRTMTIDYVPIDALYNIESNIKTGDICAIIYANKTDIFAAHMFLIAEKDGKKIIRESSNDKMTTYDTPYREWVMNIKNKKDRYCGIAIMRVREELNTPGRIIKPWEISLLKEKVNDNIIH